MLSNQNKKKATTYYCRSIIMVFQSLGSIVYYYYTFLLWLKFAYKIPFNGSNLLDHGNHHLMDIPAPSPMGRARQVFLHCWDALCAATLYLRAEFRAGRWYWDVLELNVCRQTCLQCHIMSYTQAHWLMLRYRSLVQIWTQSQLN